MRKCYVSLSNVVSRILLPVAFALLATVVVTNVNAQFANVPVTGFNQDIVADVSNSPASASTSAAVDGTALTNFVFVTPTYQRVATTCATTAANGWPATITSTNTATGTGITYSFQAATANNTLELSTTAPFTSSGTLTLVTPRTASSFYLVCLGGAGTSSFSVQFNFSDGTTETVPGVSAPDWCGGGATNKLPNATTPQIFHRIARNAAACGANCQYMYELPAPISTANWGKTINSITITTTSATFLNVLAVGARDVCSLANGTYTIDNSIPASNPGARIFKSFNDAYNHIKCGINQPVIFNVVNNAALPAGPYNEQLVMNAVPGADLTNTITFKGNGSTITFPTTATQRAVIKMDSVRYVTFDSLVVVPTGATWGYGIQLLRNSDNDTIRHCTINVNATSNSVNFAGIVMNGAEGLPTATGASACDNNGIDGNIITGGYYGITDVGSGAPSAGNGTNTFSNNIIRDFYQYGIYVTSTFNTTFDHNHISRPTRVAPIGAFNGIYFTGTSATATISRNRIMYPFGGDPANTGAFYGIKFDNVAVPSGLNFTVVNNLIADSSGNGLAYGIDINGAQNINFIHNTISIDYVGSTSTAATRGVSETGTVNGLIFYNNIIKIARGGTGVKHGLYFGTPAGIVSDYNDLYISGVSGATAHVGFSGSNRTTLAAWQATGNDLTSFSTDPIFRTAGTSSHIPQSAIIDNRAAPFLIPIDIDSNARNLGAPGPDPDMGCYEFIPPTCVAPPIPGFTTIYGTRTYADTVCYGTIVPLGLDSNSNGFTQTYQWQSSPDNVTYTNIDTPTSSPDYLLSAVSTLWYRAKVRCGTDSLYSVPMLLHVKLRLPGGTYTINSAAPYTYVSGVSGGNFKTFNQVKDALECGIGGTVIVNVQYGDSGIYNEQLRLDTIPYQSPINSLTFNGNHNKITYAATATNEKATIKLCGAKYITFNNLVIEATGAAQGFGVQLLKDADSNTFRQCRVLIDTTKISNAFCGIVINGSHTGAITANNSNCDANVFDKDTIIGGYYGMVAMDTAGYLMEGNQFTGNVITEFYNSGIYLGIGNKGTLVEHNRITRPARTTNIATIYGIYATGASSNMMISKNKIHNLFGANNSNTSTQYGIHFVDADANSDVNANTVVNNLIFHLTGAGPIYGIANSSSDYANYWHNTIAIENVGANATGLSRGFYQFGGTLGSGIQFKNNIVTVTRDGSAAKHAVYVSAATSDIDMNYNDYYVEGAGTNNYIGFWGAAAQQATTIPAWNAASSGRDLNSFNYDPGWYATIAAENYSPVVAPLDNQGTPLGIPQDINDNPRTAPDIGAFEFTVPPCSNPAAVTTATITQVNTPSCINDPITLNIPGAASASGLTYVWTASTTGTPGTFVPISPALYFPKYTFGAAGPKYFQAQIICNGTTTLSTIVVAVMDTYLVPGDYTINPGLPDNYVGVPGANFSSFNSANNKLKCGIVGDVRFHASANTFSEQVLINSIPRSVLGPQAKVTFVAANGNAATSILTYNALAATANYTLKIDSVDFVRFRNLTIKSENPALGRVVEFAGTSSDDSLVSCNIIAPAATLGTDVVAAVYVKSIFVDSIIVKDNTVTGGSNGIYFSGNSATALMRKTHLIDGNTVSGSYSHGIAINFTNRMPVTNNTVSLSGANQNNSAAIYANNADTVTRIQHNLINIDNESGAVVHGIYVAASHNPNMISDSSIVSSNRVIAGAGNTRTVNGITITTSKMVKVVNNVISITSSGDTSCGLYNLNNTATTGSAQIDYLNNSVNFTTPASKGYPGYFSQTTAQPITVYNNIFSNSGGGKALFVNNPANFTADYNMLYTTGAALVQVSTPAATTFATLKDWTNTWNWDEFSISYPPAFVSNTDLHPNTAVSEAWAMHGRGVQYIGNTFDFDGNYRPDSLKAGVPDLGAYEFAPPAILPTVLLATPATPAANSTQIFSYGTDTVMRITWGSSAPPSIEIRRFSGVVPTGLASQNLDSMYFYTKVYGVPGTSYNYAAKLYYVPSWLGSIPPQERKVGFGHTVPAGPWVISPTSKNNIALREVSQSALNYFERFTGLINPAAPPEIEDSNSNRGKDFWIGYQRTNGFAAGNAQTMKVYMGAGAVGDSVTVTIHDTVGGRNPSPGCFWQRTYWVPPYTTVVSDDIPEGGCEDARLENEGLYTNYGIHITSQNTNVVAYAHTYEGANSGATMLMPTPVWGYENYILTSRQYYSTASYSAFHVVAREDSTWVDINPAKPTLGGWVHNGGNHNGSNYLVKLNKGDVYQVLGAISTGSEGQDLTGSYVKSVANAQGQCHPIAVFAGSTRTGIGCNNTTGSSGDLINQQVFPYQAWGTKYATAPTSNDQGPTATSNMEDIFRVLVKDTSTNVYRNGILIPHTQLIGARYYQFQSSVGDYITSSQPVLLAQFMSSNGACNNTSSDGDPEMFYISPLEQGIKATQFYRNDQDAIDENFATLVIPNEGLSSLKIDGINYAVAGTSRFTSAHPNLPGYSIVTIRWDGTAGSSRVESQFPFTGIVYGLGSVESYGYNLGTLVKNLQIQGDPNPVNNPLAPPGYTCVNAPFITTVYIPIIPSSITWQFSQVPNLSPANDTTVVNPVYAFDTTVNGVHYYAYTLNYPVTITDTTGIIQIPIKFTNAFLERCDTTQSGTLYINVLPAPIVDFQTFYPHGGPNACVGDSLTFTGDVTTQNGLSVIKWYWDLTNGTTTLDSIPGQIQGMTYPTAGTYPVRLIGVSGDGCLSDTIKQIIVSPVPIVNVVRDTISACPGDTVRFSVLNPDPNYTYYWYDSLAGTMPRDSGVLFTVTNFTIPDTFYVEALSPSGCRSTRVRVQIMGSATFPAPVVTAAPGSTSITWSWPAVPGAVSYSVAVGTGPFTSIGNVLTYVENGVPPLQQVCIVVRAEGTTPCEVSFSTPVCAQVGCPTVAVVVVDDTLTLCPGSPALFEVQSPVAGYTYSWYDSATGGTVLGSGTTFNPTINSDTTFYVGANSGGCITNRTKVVAQIIHQLPPPVVTCTSTSNTITFTWTAVPGATGYQVNDGSGWAPPSGPGTSHTISGLVPLDIRNLQVKALGDSACQESVAGTAQCQTVCNGFAVPVVQDTIRTCTGGSVTFNVAPPTSGTYNWYSDAATTVLVGTGTSYTASPVTVNTPYWVVQTLGGCTSAATQVVAELLPTLTAPVVSVLTSTSTSVTFTWNSVANAVSYEVVVNGVGGNTPIGGPLGTTYIVSPMQPQDTVNVRIVVYGDSACQTVGSLPVTGQAGCNNVVIQAVDSVITHCVNEHFVFNIQPAGYTYVWYTSPAATPADSFHTGQVLDTALTATTSFWVIGTDNASHCRSGIIRVTGIALPLLAAPIITHVDTTPTSLTFTWSAVPGASGYEVMSSNNPGTSWQAVGSVTSYTISNLIPLQTVTFMVRAVGGAGCQASEADTAIAKTSSDVVFIPNTFTPNGDGHNDVLRAYSIGNIIKDMKLMIFNQWGEKVFESSSPQTGWDGKYKGKAQPVGVYMYVGKFTLTNGNVLDKKGSINLVR